jgi:hypothetical protein
MSLKPYQFLSLLSYSITNLKVGFFSPRKAGQRENAFTTKAKGFVEGIGGKWIKQLPEVPKQKAIQNI